MLRGASRARLGSAARKLAMGYPFALALRYLASKRGAFVSVGTAFAVLGVTLAVAALTIVVSVTGGFNEQFREKVLGVNAHVLVLKYSVDFREYRDVMRKVEKVPGVVGVAPFVINPMMITHGERTATGVLLKGVDPELMPSVLDLPKHIVSGSLDGWRRAGSKPPQRPRDSSHAGSPSSPSTVHSTRGAESLPSLDDVDAGGTGKKLSLLEAIERQIAEDEARKNEPDAGSATARPALAAHGEERDEGEELASLPGGPIGDVTPSGGFASELPDEDFLPEEVDPDPCRSPEQVKKLPGAVIGRSLARQLNASIGDCVQVTSPTIGLAYGASARPPIAKQFRIIAEFEAGFDQYDSKLVYADLHEAQAFYEYGDSVTGVEMKVADIDRARFVSKEVDALLSNSVYHTMDWRELNHGLFTALLIQQLTMSLVLALITIVASFTVVATLVMVVLEKRKEIALLKAIGASNDAILRVFLYQGGMIGIVGTIFGLALGYGGCKALVAYAFPLDPKVYFISRLPVELNPLYFAIIGGFAIFVCLLATLFPALYAANLRPSDGLRAD